MISSVRGRRRYRLGGGGAAVLALGLLLLLSTGLTQASAAIPFERCQEAGAEDWECAKHTVPLDWTGKVPGTIDLEVRRYRPPGSPDPSAKLPFFPLAGGPGQGAIRGSFRGRVRVRGNRAARGRLKFKANGNVVGRLNGKRVRYRAGK